MFFGAVGLDASSSPGQILPSAAFLGYPVYVVVELDGEELTKCLASDLSKPKLSRISCGKVDTVQIVQARLCRVDIEVGEFWLWGHLPPDARQLLLDLMWRQDGYVEVVTRDTVEGCYQMSSPCEPVGWLEVTKKMVHALRGAGEGLFVKEYEMLGY